MSGLLAQYKAFVRKHPSLVLNAERLLHWLAWTPERFSGSEYAYEAFNAAVGLLGIYNESILSERPGQEQVARWALWLAALEQVQTLIELRAIHLEQRGKMSRYGPLIALEVLKCSLRMALWRSSGCKLALQEVSREDEDQQESEQQLKELLQALTRLREQYSYGPATAPTPEHLQYNMHLAHAAAVRAAAVAPHRPPAACAVGATAGAAGMSVPGCGVAVPDAAAAGAGAGTAHRAPLQQQQQQRCGVCGAVQEGGGGGSCMDQQQQPHTQQLTQPPQCKVCGRPLPSGSGSKRPAGTSEIVPADDQPSSSAGDTASSSSSGGGGSQLRRGWWQAMTGGGGSSSSSSGQRPQQPGSSSTTASLAGSLPGTWGPALRPALASLDPRSSGGKADARWLQQHQPASWRLSPRDAGIGHAVMVAGELVHVVRPLVYVVLLRRYGLSSWRPWLASLALDLASGYGLHTGQAILERSNASRWPVSSTLYSLALLRGLSSTHWSPGERQELLARRLLLLRYLLRSPCYNALTRKLLLKVVAGSRYMPGLSNLADFAFSMVEGMQGLYTYVES